MRRTWIPLLALLLMGPPLTATRGEGAAPSALATTEAEGTQYWFGVAVENIPPAIARLLKLKPDQGLMVMAVLPNSPAQVAGLKADDLLVAIDDVPLTSQQELARAANTLAANGNPKVSRIAYLRDGNDGVALLMPAPRPTSMLVVNDLSGDFSASTTKAAAGGAEAGAGASVGKGKGTMQAFNYVLPNGNAAQVGPGYRIPLQADAMSTQTVRSIREIVSQGQTLVLSQETDRQGTVRNTITVGNTVYAVDPQHLDALPAELRPLGLKLLTPLAVPAASEPAAETLSPMEQEQALKAENEALRAENEALKKRLPVGGR